MPATAVALVLAAALLHALWNAIAKHARGDQLFAFLQGASIVLFWWPAAWWFGRVSLAWGAAQWTAAFASAAVHIAYYAALFRGYREADLTVVYPVARGTGPLITAAFAVLWLHERLTLLATIGILSIGAGVFLIAGGLTLLRPPATTEAGAFARIRAGLRWGGLTGLTVAAYSAVDGYAIKVLLVNPVVYLYLSNVLRVALQAPWVLRDRTALLQAARSQWRHVVSIALLSPVAYVLVLLALQQAPLSHVAPTREASMLFAALLGGWMFQERDRASRLAGAALVAAGVAVLALG